MANIAVWQDINLNGKTDIGELHSLDQLGILSLTIQATESTYKDANGNSHKLAGSYSKNDGTVLSTADVWFNVNLADTISKNETPVESDVAALPNASGSGTLDNLHLAMQADSSGRLKSLVAQFTNETDSLKRNRLIQEIVFKWADADSVQIDSRGGGGIFDARRLTVMERFSGEAYVSSVAGTVLGSNPNLRGMSYINNAFSELEERVYSQLMVQTHFKNIFQAIDFTEYPDGRITSDLSALPAIINSWMTQEGRDAELSLKELSRVIKGLNIPESIISFDAIRNAITSSGFTFSSDFENENGRDIFVGTDQTVKIVGGFGFTENFQFAENEQILYQEACIRSFVAFGGESNESFTGAASNDTLLGGGGRDSLFGDAGEDVLEGQSGDDVLDGQTGSDTYIFHSGFGNDTLTDSGEDGETNIIQFAEGLNASAFEVGRYGDDLALQFRGLDDQVTLLMGTTHQLHRISSIVFADGTVICGDDLVDLSYNGTVRDDYIVSQTGNKYLGGKEGNDYLVGSIEDDTFDGGTGDDTLNGSGGSNTYLFGIGDGHDVIEQYEIIPGEDSRILFKSGIIQSDIAIERKSYGGVLSDDLTISIYPSGDSIDIQNFFYQEDPLNEYNPVQYIEFDDGTTWDINMILSRTNEGRLGKYVFGTEANDIFSGEAENDTLMGLGGDDLYISTGGRLFIQEDVNGGIDTVQTDSDFSLDSYDNVENLTLTGTGDISGTGNSLNNYITGNVGANILNGAAGNDTLVANSVDDQLIGGLGDDTYIINDAATVIMEDSNSGHDTVVSSVDFSLATVSNFENATLAGNDAISLTGNSINNLLIGNSANNVISGGSGADSMQGGGGDDTYIVDNIGDIVNEYEGGGSDLIKSSVSYTLLSNVEKLTLTGSSSLSGVGNELNNSIIGNTGANVIRGELGNDTLNGGAGADSLFGGLGDDTFVVDNLSDNVFENENEGSDLIQSSVTWTLGLNIENLNLTGSSALNGTGNTLNNRLFGNTGANTLTGGLGNDTLNGGTGADSLVGGVGDDLYVVDNISDKIGENVSEGVVSSKVSVMDCASEPREPDIDGARVCVWQHLR